MAKIKKDDENKKEKLKTKKVHKKKKKLTKEEKKKLREKYLKIMLLFVALFLINIYIILGIFFKKSDFTISLDYVQGKKPSLLIYESPEDKTEKTYLRCEDIDFLTDISINSIPSNINDEADGSHHGDHFIAYTFYVENNGEEAVNYWISSAIEEQIKEVDEAVRFMIYQNGERTVYAKRATSGNPEPGTVPFKDEETIMLKPRKNIKPGEIDKYTVVIFLEGSDPQCVNAIIGGEISMSMRIIEEHITKEEQEEIVNEVDVQEI